jgi:hypothetical protein
LRRAEGQANAVRRHTEVSYGAKSWRCQRRVAARIEATPKGLDIRYVVTNLTGGGAGRNVSTTLIQPGLEFKLWCSALVQWLCGWWHVGLRAEVQAVQGSGDRRAWVPHSVT